MSVTRRFYVLGLAGVVTLAAAVSLSLALSARAATTVFPCHASQLHLRGLGEQGATGNRFYEFAFTNRGFPCTIKGYPRLTLLNKHGHIVTATVTHWAGTHASRITLGHTRRAFFFVRYLDGAFCAKAKRLVAFRLELFVPGATSGAIYNVVPVNRGPASLCRGTLQVSPLRLTASPVAADAVATPICAPSGLRLDAVAGQGFTSHREIVFGLRNVTARTCHLKGYPGVAALNAHAGVLTPSAARRPGSKPTIVLHTWQRAFFAVVYTVGGPCVPHTVTAYALQVIPPGATGRLVYYLGPTSLCAPPSLTVTAVSHSSAP